MVDVSQRWPFLLAAVAGFRLTDIPQMDGPSARLERQFGSHDRIVHARVVIFAASAPDRGHPKRSARRSARPWGPTIVRAGVDPPSAGAWEAAALEITSLLCGDRKSTR